MRKIVIHRPGGHERLEIEEHPTPEPGPGEVRVAVRAIGTGFADCLIRMGLYKSSKDQIGWPVTPGFEVAGHVDAVGTSVEDLEPGEPVLAVPRFGGYASHVVVSRPQVFRVPNGLSLEQAAALPTVFLTAYYAWFLLVHPRGDETALVHSAAGGVGGALVQLGKLAGCRVVGVVGAPHKVDAARGFGADAVIDKSSEDLWAEARRHAPDRYDVVFDANGVETLKDSLRHVGSPGKLVIYGFHTMLEKGRDRPSWWKLIRAWWKTPRFDPLRLTNRNRSVLAFNLSYQFDRLDLLQEVMADLLRWIEEGEIHPPPVSTFAFEQVAEAHRALESGHTVGKVVLTV
jgi:NADPH:quinone reductase-like Zn-dependent oxidoreductase